jgi:uncharacterized membrane protein
MNAPPPPLRAPASRWIALASLAAMIPTLLLPTPTAWTITVSIPVLILLITGLKPPPRWGGWASAAMVPYLAIALGEAIADPDGRMLNWMTAGCALLVFFTSIDFVRRTGVSLRR